MPPLTFDQFKTIFEFSLEALGVVGGIGTVIYKSYGFTAVWSVARGDADSGTHAVAVDTVREGGGIALEAVRQTAHILGDHNHRAEGERLSALRMEASRPASEEISRTESPGRMV
jgi:hypothetical protein